MPVGKSGNNNKNQFSEEFPKEPLLEVQRPRKSKKPDNNDESSEPRGKKKPMKNDYELERLAAIKENENHDDEVIPSSKTFNNFTLKKK